MPSPARKVFGERPMRVVERIGSLNAVDSYQADIRVVAVQSVDIAEVSSVAVDPDMDHRVVVDLDSIDFRSC